MSLLLPVTYAMSPTASIIMMAGVYYGAMYGGSTLKAVAMALLGMLLGTIGLDPITAAPRFTYGKLTLADGLGFVPIIMGLFGISEVLLNIEKGVEQEVFDTRIKGLLPSREDW